MNRTSTTRAMVVAMATLAASASALAQGPFKSATTTAGGFHTWDSDLVNIESVPQTGKGVYVAVLDTGLVPHWRDYFPEARVATHLGTGFFQPVSFKAKKDVCGLGVTVGKLQQSTWVGSRGSTHGTHVASTILGYSYRSNSDAAGGFPLPPIMVRGIAPDVTIIPVRVLADYQVPALPACGDGIPARWRFQLPGYQRAGFRSVGSRRGRARHARRHRYLLLHRPGRVSSRRDGACHGAVA
jgi:hypothetical protein